MKKKLLSIAILTAGLYSVQAEAKTKAYPGTKSVEENNKEALSHLQQGTKTANQFKNALNKALKSNLRSDWQKALMLAKQAEKQFDKTEDTYERIITNISQKIRKMKSSK